MWVLKKEAVEGVNQIQAAQDMVQWQTCEHGDGPAGSVKWGVIRNSFLLGELS